MCRHGKQWKRNLKMWSMGFGRSLRSTLLIRGRCGHKNGVLPPLLPGLWARWSVEHWGPSGLQSRLSRAVCGQCLPPRPVQSTRHTRTLPAQSTLDPKPAHITPKLLYRAARCLCDHILRGFTVCSHGPYPNGPPRRTLPSSSSGRRLSLVEAACQHSQPAPVPQYSHGAIGSERPQPDHWQTQAACCRRATSRSAVW